MKPYIELNSEKRKLAKNDFEKDFFKLMNNAVFGKTMENVRKRINLELVSNTERLEKLIARPEFKDRTIFSENLAAIHLMKTSVKFDKPIYIGQAVLDLSKTLMYNYYYKILKSKYEDKLQLLYTDTDSFIVEIKTKDFYLDMLDDLDLYDTSNYPSTHICYSSKNKKTVGKFKDESEGKIITHFIGLRSKLYTYKKEDKTEEKRAKGISKPVINKSLCYDDY